MWHVGMDWHSRQTSLTVRDSHGRKLYSRHVRGGVDAVVRELRKLKGPFSVTFEASTGYGHVYDEIAKVAHTVRVAHPGHRAAHLPVEAEVRPPGGSEHLEGPDLRAWTPTRCRSSTTWTRSRRSTSPDARSGPGAGRSHTAPVW
jgi:hypothetical protein